MVHAQFAQPGAAFARGPASVPAVAYGDERPVRLAGDEPFDAADDLELAFALAGLPGGVVPGGLVVSQADDGDAVQRHVALPVAALVEPVPAGPAAGCGQRARAAEFGERGFAPDAFGVVAGDDGQGRGDDGAHAVHVEQRSRVLLEDRAHALLQEARLPFERLPCLGGGFQRDQRAMLDQAAGGPALGESVHTGPALQSPVPFPDGLRSGDEQAVGRVGNRRHRRHQLGALGVEVAQCLDPAVRAFRRAGVVAGHDAAGGGDRVDGIGLAVPAAHVALGTQHLAHLVSGGREPAGQGRAERVRALHTHGRDRARPGQHVDQSVVSVRVRRERFGAQRPSPFVKQCDGVRVRVGIDPSPHHSVRRRHRRRSFPCVRMPPGACGADRTLTGHATMTLAGFDGSGHAPMRSCIHGPRVGGRGGTNQNKDSHRNRWRQSNRGSPPRPSYTIITDRKPV